jgi:acetyl-CoA carboxylase carboxyltransferase component/biotin carboxyl carrier protein
MHRAVEGLVATSNHICHEYADIALLHAATSFYEERLALEQEQFYASATRGRPQVCSEAGTKVELRYEGHSYSLQTYRLSAQWYRIEVDGTQFKVRVEPLARFESWLTALGRRSHVVSVPDDRSYRIEVNGVPHKIDRDDGGIVCSPTPAVVVSVLVKPGEVVSAGDPVAVLESMKMELPVQAPFAGRVRRVMIIPNMQVDSGAPVMQIDAVSTSGIESVGERVVFKELHVEPDDSSLTSDNPNLDPVRQFMLGFDVDPKKCSQAVADWNAQAESDDEAIQQENEILNIFADVCSLFKREPETGKGAGGEQPSAEAYMFSYLRSIDAGSDGLPQNFSATLRQALRHYGVTTLDRSPQLEQSLFWIHKSHQRMSQQIPVVVEILRRRMQKLETLPQLAQESTRSLLERLIAAGNGLFPSLCDLAQPEPIKPLTEYEQKVARMQRFGLIYQFEIVKMITRSSGDTNAEFPAGDFIEYDLNSEGRLVPVDRPYGQNKSAIIVGVIRNFTLRYPEGMKRVILLGDPSKDLGAVAEPECRLILAALELARQQSVPIEWFTLCAGARISMESGVENMDWIARVLRELVQFTQNGGEINLVVNGINVGAQPYWNAEATMLMHTRGVLIMTPKGAMVLTGKRALEYSGSVSAEDNQGIGGYDRIMGVNGQAQYWARDIEQACHMLLRHYEYAYVAPGERFPRRDITSDPVDRDVCQFSMGEVNESGFLQVGDIFSDKTNPGRKKAFPIRKVMMAVVDQDHSPLERWAGMRGAETAVVWDAHLGGNAVCLIGIESRPVPRMGFVPADGPERWCAGTLFPQSSKKVARAINSASNNRPVVLLANLSGFDGSPESMRRLQLEYGAEIGRAVVNFKGPMVFCVVSRYHGGAYVVFSRALNENLEVAALEGTYASVIGGAPAAAVVFAGEVSARARKDERMQSLAAQREKANGAEKATLQAEWDKLYQIVHSEKLGQVADEFDRIHTVQRALKVGALDHIIQPANLRSYLIEAVERGIAKEVNSRPEELRTRARDNVSPISELHTAKAS